jgi:hypothetical protein
MTRTLAHQTRVFIQIAIDDDSGNVAALIMTLTVLVNLLVRCGQFIKEAALLVSDFVEAAKFTNTVFTIGFKSLAYGFVGVRL